MFGAPLVRATVMHHQRRPSASNLPSSSAVHAAIMATSASNKSNNGRVAQDTTSALAASKPKSKYAETDMQMFVDSPFVGGAMLSPESTSTQSTNKAKPEFNLKYFNPSSDPRLLAM
ncbi:hypothetical protein RhiJN_09113 [Ceratobasidium sp. AG-Ba]|nr:hypothetical protein RhiJN_09113 [Ceratobasidium sp. AG-Ba]QRW09883.1 hypothetical protein RhiLY_08882 [Ceratobasidium sp. AG-Ba]